MECEGGSPHFGDLRPWSEVSPAEARLWEAEARRAWNSRDGKCEVLGFDWQAYRRARKNRPPGGWRHPWTKGNPGPITRNPFPQEWDWLRDLSNDIVRRYLAQDKPATRH